MACKKDSEGSLSEEIKERKFISVIDKNSSH